ncbi:hypothetical protein DMH17_17125 [Raoultella planticola]|nr:hypothetical protein [Raoultella planticola]
MLPTVWLVRSGKSGHHSLVLRKAHSSPLRTHRYAGPTGDDVKRAHGIISAAQGANAELVEVPGRGLTLQCQHFQCC